MCLCVGVSCLCENQLEFWIMREREDVFLEKGSTKKPNEILLHSLCYDDDAIHWTDLSGPIIINSCQAAKKPGKEVYRTLIKIQVEITKMEKWV